MTDKREQHPAPAATDRNGERQISPQPAAQDIVRNFGQPYGTTYDSRPAPDRQQGS